MRQSNFFMASGKQNVRAVAFLLVFQFGGLHGILIYCGMPRHQNQIQVLYCAIVVYCCHTIRSRKKYDKIFAASRSV